MDWEKGFASLQGCIQSDPANLAIPINLTNLHGQVVLITGGASGFGAGIALKAALNGAHVIIGDINTKLGTETAAILRSKTNNQNHHFLPLDVTSWSSQAAFFKQAASLSPHGGIDTVIANAGISDLAEGDRFEEPPDYASLPDNPPEPSITRTLDINFKGVFYTTHLALSYLPRNPHSQACSTQPNHSDNSHGGARDRQLILVSSMAGIAPLPVLASYCAAKHGVVGLFRALRVTAPQRHGVRVNMVNPYFSATPIIGAAGEAIMAGGDLAAVDDVIDAVLRFLCDQSIVGRGLLVAPKATDHEMQIAGLDGPGPVWDIYADDFAQTDLFVRRIIAVTNLKVKAKGWVGFLSDLVVAFTKPLIKRLQGRK